MHIATVFEGLDWKDARVFHERYRAQFNQWAAEYRKRGKSCAIVFDVLPGHFPSLDLAGNLIWTGAWFTAELERRGDGLVMVIRPASDKDRHLMEVHCHNLRRHTCR